MGGQEKQGTSRLFDRRASDTYHGAGELIARLEGREVDRDLARLAALALLGSRARGRRRSSSSSLRSGLLGSGVGHGRGAGRLRGAAAVAMEARVVGGCQGVGYGAS